MSRVALVFAVIGCWLVFAGSVEASSSPETIAPMQAVFMAATVAPDGVAGTFKLRIQSAGRQDGNIYLDSEKDYRDQRNLCIAVLPAGAKSFRAKFGADPDKTLVGKWIRVTGVARRVKITITDFGEETGKYYYQTHVDVTSVDQIQIEEH